MTSDIGIDAVYIQDAQSRQAVPVAGDLKDDGSGIIKWWQALFLAIGALDGPPIVVSDADGQRVPVEAPNLLAALQGTLLAADDTPPYLPTNSNGVTITQDSGIVELCPSSARSRITVACLNPATNADGSAAPLVRVWIGIDRDPPVGLTTRYVNNEGVWEDFMRGAIRICVDPDPRYAGLEAKIAFDEVFAGVSS